MPHVYCLRDPGLILLQSVSDGLIALSYFMIPFWLVWLVRRRKDLAFRSAFLLFSAFILACGTTHILSVVTLWHPVYRLEGLVKALTAVASLGTAIMLVRLAPQAAAIPTSEDLRKEIEVRKLAEEEVRKLNARLEGLVAERTGQLEAANAHILKFAPALDRAPIIIQTLDGTIVFWNSGAEELYGWTGEEALGRKSHELMSTELPQPLDEIQSRLREHGNWAGEFRQKRRDGSEIWVSSHWTLHLNEAGEPLFVVKLNNDITALKRTARALRSSDATVRSLFENASQAIVTVDGNGTVVDANGMALRLFGYSREEMLKAPVESLLPERYRRSHAGQRAAYALKPHIRPMGKAMDLEALRKDGSVFPVEISLSYVAEHGDGLTVAFISDITARRQASEEREALIGRLEAALSEKTVLLKEVHHRVKNNLAVIAGLLSLQADTLEEERSRIALQESQQRVLSMALIHEYLYATQHLDRVNFGEYVHQLCSELSVTYAVVADLVTMEVEAENIDLGVHRAIPCGLILNELLSNALKYAFPDGRSGRIEVRFRRLESGELSLVCQDDGVGMKPGFDWRNSQSLGLRIVRILTNQIGGTLALDESHAGTRFELRLDKGSPGR